MFSEFGSGFQATILLDSVNLAGCRLVTWVLRYPRFIHAELLTHRQFSRNSSSSRAIPIEKMIQQVLDEPVLPVYWGRNQPGMQAREALDGTEEAMGKARWLAARDRAVIEARSMVEIGVHKQIVNRILEPWMWITVVLSTTTHTNFLALRDHPDAQPEIAYLAKLMAAALKTSEPTLKRMGQWHLPFIRPEDQDLYIDTKIQVSIARCARVSYLTHDGVRSIDKDITLYNKLLASKPPHVSPFEHVAQATDDRERRGNFIGWYQRRKDFPIECQPQEYWNGALHE